MTDHLDTTRDRMIQALLGELSDDEHQELMSAIESDEDLLRDWDEIRQAQAFIASAHSDAIDPAFDFSLPPEPNPKQEITRLRSRYLRQFGLIGAGFAAATVLFCVLVVSGFRVDRTPDGMLVSFSQPTSTRSTDEAMVAQLITRSDLEDALIAVLDVTRARFDELERTQDGQQAYYSKLLYEALATTQQRQFDDLRTRIELAAYVDPYQPSRSNPNQGD